MRAELGGGGEPALDSGGIGFADGPSYRFFQPLPFDHRSHYSGDGFLRSMNFTHPDPLRIDLEETIGLTMHASATFYARRRSSQAVFSDAAAPGRAFMNGPGETYHLAVDGECRVVQLNLPDQLFERFLLEDHDLSGGMSALRPPHGIIDTELLRLSAWALLAEQEQREVAIRSIVARLAIAHGAGGSGLRTRGLPPARLRKVRDFVESNLADVTLTSMALEAGLSVFHFSREFRRETGQTPWSFVIFQRVWRAVELLRMGEPAEDVARRVGFADASHMRRGFRKTIGSPPASASGRLLP